MRLLLKQALFVELLSGLIRYAGPRGYILTLGEGHIDLPRLRGALKDILGRPPTPQEVRKVYGHRLSGTHPRKLGQDLNLFLLRRGRLTWIRTAHPAWNDLGEYWLALDPLCRWGGKFKSRAGKPTGDYNHFSLAHLGAA